MTQIKHIQNNYNSPSEPQNDSLTDYDFEVAPVKPEEGDPGSSAGRATGEAHYEASGSLVRPSLLTVDTLRGR